MKKADLSNFEYVIDARILNFIRGYSHLESYSTIFDDIRHMFKVEIDVNIAQAVIQVFGYQAIDWLPYELKSNVAIMRTLFQREDAEKYVAFNGDLVILNSPAGGKAVVVYNDIVCVEATPFQVASILKDYSFFEKLPYADFRLNEHGNSASNELVKVVLSKMRNDVKSAAEDQVDKELANKTSETIKRYVAKTEDAEKVVAEQDYLYHMGMGYVDSMKKYKAKGEESLAYVEAVNIPLGENKVDEEKNAFDRCDDFMEISVQEYVDKAIGFEYAAGDKGSARSYAIGNVYKDLDSVIKEFEILLKGKMEICTLTNDFLEALKRKMIAVYKNVEAKIKGLEEYFKNKNEILDMIDDAESRLIR